MEITYQGLRIILPFDGVIQVEDFNLNASFQEHASVHMLLLMEEEGIEDNVHGLADGAGIEIFEEQLLFSGKIIMAGMEIQRGLHFLQIQALSYTVEWSLVPVSQSFLDQSASYEQVLKQVVLNHPGADVKDCVTKGAKIPGFLLQYEETDWDFLIRLASHFQTFLIPDYKMGYGRAYFGIPSFEDEVVLGEGEYQTTKDMDRYYHVNVSGELLTQEIMKWEVKINQSFYLAQKIQFRGIDTIVTGIQYSVVGGELCRFYELSRKKGCLSVRQKNKNIFGMSIPAIVKERAGNCVRVHFNIDKTYQQSPQAKYFTYALESSMIYCMPEIGSQVHIYFPSDEEQDAIAVHALRTAAGDQGSSGGGYAQKPDYKSFSNVNGAELLLAPSFANVAAEAEKTTQIHLDTEGNATIEGKEIELRSSKNLSIGIPSEEGGEPTNCVRMEAGKITAQIGEDGEAMVELTEEANIIATFIKLEASDTTPPSNPSADDILTQVIAGDKDARDEINNNASALLVDKYQKGRDKIMGGAAKILGALAVVGGALLFAAATVATAGAAAAFLGPAMIGTYVFATTTVVAATADIMEGIGDVEKSQSGSLDQSFNFVRDTLFGGNQKAYDIAKVINDIVFGIVSGKAIGSALKVLGGAGKFFKFACNAKQLKTLNSVVQVGGNVFSGALNNLAYTGKLNVKDLCINIGIGLVQGQAGTGITNGILGKIGIQGMSPGAAKALEVGVGTIVDTNLDWFISSLTGKEFNYWESLGKNAFTNGLSSSIADPVDAVTGGYILQNTDLILASLPKAFEVERIYHTTNQNVSAFGKGWSFAYDSQIYRDNQKPNAIHMNTITGHLLWFEKEEDQWINKSKGTGRFRLVAEEENQRYLLTDVMDHTLCIYDRTGKLTRVDYPNQQSLLFTYTTEGLTGITTPLGNTLEVVSKAGKILQIKDEIGRITQYRYEGDLLTHVIHMDEGITHYTYDHQGYIASVTDQNGVRYLENQYDDRGRITRQTFENGIYQTFTYDNKHRRNTVYYSETGKQESYEYNRELLTERILYEDGTFVDYTYSDQNLRTSETSRCGYATTWDYDEYGHLLQETTPDGYTVYYEYDEPQNLIKVWDTEQRETHNYYDANHNLLKVEEKISPELYKETRYGYDEQGRCIATEDGLGKKTKYCFDQNRAYPSRVVTPKEEETLYEYDRVGRRMSITNAYGTVQLGYNSRNFVTKRTDGEGYTSHWFFDRMGNLTSYYPAKQWKRQESGYEYRYDFLERLVDTISPEKEHQRVFRNFDGDIIKEIHPTCYDAGKEDGEGTRYTYDWDGNCIRIHSTDGGVERRFYDADGNLTKQVLPQEYDTTLDDGPGYTYAYDSVGRLTTIWDPEGSLLQTYEYNGHGQVIREIDGEGKEICSRYNLLDQKVQERISIRKEKDVTFYRVVSYAYDSQGNKVEEAYGVEEVTKEQEPSSYQRIGFTYDANNHLTLVEDEFGAKVRYDYDCLGNLLLEEQVIEIEEENQVNPGNRESILKRIRYGYNKNGWRIRKEEEIQGNGTVDKAVTTYAYDENGNVIKIITPGGFEIRRSYDANDRLVKERTLDRKNGMDRTLCYTYDAAGNLLEETLQGVHMAPLCTRYHYDLKNRQTHEINPSGGVTRYLYNQNDQRIQEISPYGYDPVSDLGKGTMYRYDSRGNRIGEINGLDQLVKTRTYNLQNRPITQTDGAGNQVHFDYTLDGQIKEIRQGAKTPLQTYQYNARGQIIGIQDGEGENLKYDLDSWGRITTLSFSDGVTEGYEYTPSGQVRKAIDGNGNGIIYRYNSFGKVRERMDQLGEKETFQYDAEGNLQYYTDRDGNQIYRSYNVFGNPVYEKAVDQNGEHPSITTYRYDGLGRLVQGVCDGHSYEYLYNEQGLLQEKRSSGTRLITYEYDKAGQITRMTDGAGVTTCYEYDSLGRTKRIFTEQGMEVDYTYDAQNRTESITYGNGIKTQYLYDAEGNLSKLETRLQEDVLLSFTYQYDGNGNRVEKVGELRCAGNVSLSAKEDSYLPVRNTYQYNVRGQLLEEKTETDTFRYTYDASGNRIQKESRGETTTYQYNEKNQLISEEGIREKKVFTYNQQGSILKEVSIKSIPTIKSISTYIYNSKNQQVLVKRGDGQVQENHYDSEGLRHEMKENGRLLQFLYHRGELLQETEGDSPTSYTLGAGIEGFQRGHETYYYHQDEQLSTALLTNNLGEVQNHYQYDAFGDTLEKAEEIPNRIQYTNQQYDTVTGQYYLRARYYNPILGRFLQEDVYQGDGQNLYAYCGNNPVMYYDPSGYAKKLGCPPGAQVGGDGGEHVDPVKTMGVNDSGHHVPAVRKSRDRPFEVERSDKSRPTLFPKGSNPEHDHWRLHDAERNHVGPRQGDYEGTDDQLFDAYRESYKELDDIKVDVKSPNGDHTLGIDVTPSKAIDLIQDWLKKNKLYD